MTESADPVEVVKQIQEKLAKNKQDLLKLEQILNNKNDEIQLLKDYER